ncbi:DUF484 family protein [Amnimonas aquatica]|uniref:DUF484 family protein n=1 Tax=Amnimonas aquatica TaxID=2094561 RepID=UPI00130503B1|nr:DUF484 family protein [Amnimonas aquatica]
MSEPLPALNAERVAAWLRQHPDFFEQHPELLSHLHIRHNSGTVSLIERQVSQLRKRNDELEERLNELMAIASDNDRLFGQLRAVILCILDSTSPAQLGTRLFNELREPFRCQQLSLLSFGNVVEAPWRSLAQAEFEQRLPGLLRNHRALAGKWRRDELRFLFGEDGLQLSSAAVIPLLEGERAIGVVSLGSTEPSHFRSSMDTLFISHLGDIIARLLSGLERRAGGTATRGDDEAARDG